jgi:hypothetical protein
VVDLYYTPGSTGGKSLSVTNNTSLTNPPPLVFNATAGWNVVSTTAFSGPVSAGVANSVLQNGWVDVAGGGWSINSSGFLVAAASGNNVASAPLLRPSSENAADYNERIVVQGTYNAQIFLIARHNRNITGGAQCYTAVYAGNAINIYKCVGGAIVTSPSLGSVSGSTINNTSTYWFEFVVVQTSTTTTTLTFTVYYPNLQTVAKTLTVTDTTASLQNATGALGIATYGSVGGSVSNAWTYTDSDGSNGLYVFYCPDERPRQHGRHIYHSAEQAVTLVRQRLADNVGWRRGRHVQSHDTYFCCKCASRKVVYLCACHNRRRYDKCPDHHRRCRIECASVIEFHGNTRAGHICRQQWGLSVFARQLEGR